MLTLSDLAFIVNLMLFDIVETLTLNPPALSHLDVSMNAVSIVKLLIVTFSSDTLFATANGLAFALAPA